MMQNQFLTPEQQEQFLTQGYTVVRGAFTREQAREWTDKVWTRLGYDADDQKTWAQSRIHMPTHESVSVADFAPQAWGAICELLGGEERIKQPSRWGDGFIVNLGSDGDDTQWVPPSPAAPGWHKDGDFFRHFLDSPEQGLLTIVLWSEVLPTGGATFVAADSVPVVARYLAQHPEGVLPNQFPFGELIGQCQNFVEATGEFGDVYLLHPYMLHASSRNALRLPRLITNPPVTLAAPMNFDRENPADFSLVERAILRGLGIERLAFHPAAPREGVVPERVRRQQQMREEEKARLAALV